MRRKRSTRGFSMLEVLAAMSLFAIVASAVTSLVTGSLRHTTLNRHGTMAAILAQQKLEDLRGMAYDDIDPTSESVVAAQQSYTIDTEVDDNTPASGMKHITVTVTWTGPEGAQSYAVETIYTSLTS